MRLSKKDACRQVGCGENMYCFGGKDPTTTPRMCPEATKILADRNKQKAKE